MSAEASDAIDDRLLAEGRYEELVSRHYEALVDRARLRLPAGEDAHEVVNAVVTRLLTELRRGRRYGVPFRVVAHQVLTWMLKDWWAARAQRPRPLPDDWDPPADEPGFEEVEGRDWMEAIITPLPPRDREVMHLRFVEGEEIAAIAEGLGMSRNAVDQALARGRRAIRERWHDG